MSGDHHQRKHSKFSASGAERWEACPGSVALSEGQPDRETPWAIEGTKAHEVLEAYLLWARDLKQIPAEIKERPKEMHAFAQMASDFILDVAVKEHADLLVETRIALDFIHPEMFGTFDSAVLDHFGVLHVFDYKYGQGHAVTPVNNLQMAFYGIGLAHRFNWNFKRVRHWIIQPRIRGFDGPTFWDVPILELKTKWVKRFQDAVRRVENTPGELTEGSWCHWCKAKRVCPLKLDARLDKAKIIFGKDKDNEDEKEDDQKIVKSEADWKRESRQKGTQKRRKHKEITTGQKGKIQETEGDFF